MTNLATDASQMLAAALEQMDDIIAGTRVQPMEYEDNSLVTHNEVNLRHTNENGHGSAPDVSRLLDELRLAAEHAVENGEGNQLRNQIEESTRAYIVRLLADKKEISADTVFSEKMKRLEGDNDSLQLQVNVLTEQIEAQNEKLQELEDALSLKTRRLANAETKLLQESEIHCELEQSQQNYALEASQLKARLDSVENETLVVRERAIFAESKIEEQQQEMAQMVTKYQNAQKLVEDLQVECHSWQDKYMETQALVDDLQTKQVRSLDEEVEKEKLKIAVDTLINGNKEKDKRIEDLSRRLSRFHHVQDLAIVQGKVDIGMLMDIDPRRTDSVSTSSSTTAETDGSKDSRSTMPESSPMMTPEKDYNHAMLVDRTEEMFGAKTSRRSASLENLQTVLGPPSSDILSDNNHSHPTPDTTHTTPLQDNITPLQDNSTPLQDNTTPLQENPDLDTPSQENPSPGLPTQDSPDTPTQTPLQPSGDTTQTINSSRSSGDSPSGSLPEDIIQLTTQGSPDKDRESNRTPPFPLTPSSLPEAVKRVNFDLEATTEIERNSVVSVDSQENGGVDHISSFLTKGEQQMKNNNGLENGHSLNGSIDSPTDITFIDIDDANVPHFRRDLSQLSGHMTLPSPKKTTDQETEISSRPNPSGYRTLPSPRRNQEFQLPAHQPSSNHSSPQPRKHRSSFSKSLFKLNSKKTSSAPNLDDKEKEEEEEEVETNGKAMTESEGEDNLGVQRPRNVTFQSLERGGYPAPPGTPPLDHRRRKGGIKKLIGKIKRSGSASLSVDDADEDTGVEFSRNSRLRATAGPRLAWSRDLKKAAPSDPNAPFGRWGGEQVADWLRDMGLAQYSAACRVWIKNGATLLTASPLEIEKYLGLKNPLHRKKVQLAVQAMGSDGEDRPGELDYHWVTRWLDDVGLPQYKDTFVEAKVDGRMLHFMTVDDLLLLKVTSAFHHISIMRGIQCLRLNNFHPSCLRRRPTDEPYETGTQVTLWTNHRVMEWLRSVDLSEYAPNLRGSGVHGGLMVLEPRFTAETLASILIIPGNKTLLRRHLSTHFISLIGPDIQQQKRDLEKQPTFIALNFIAKVKPKKRTFRKRGQEVEDYVCPMDLGTPAAVNGSGHMNGSRPPPPSYKVEVRSAGKIHRQRDEGPEGKEVKEGTAEKFGALSSEISSLTTMLSESEQLDRSTHV